MDYQELGLGEATSVVTAVTVDKDEQSILLSCLYNPQEAPMSYTLWFKQCEQIVWNTFDAVLDLQYVEAELVGLSLQTTGTQKRAVITTDMFELSFGYRSLSLQPALPNAHAARI